MTDILSRWPSRRAILEDARDINPTLGMFAVHRWFHRGFFPGKYDGALMRGAKRRGIDLRLEEIMEAREAVAISQNA